MVTTLQSLTNKLHPANFTKMSGMMASIVGCVLDADFANPKIVELIVTSDRMVMARVENDCGFNHFIGTVADLQRNWDCLLDAAELTEEERQFAMARFASTIKGS